MGVVLDRFLDACALLSLETLTIDAGLDWPWPKEELLDFTDKSSCQSRDNPITLDCLVPLMRSMPDVVSFRVDVDEPVRHTTLDTMKSEKLLPKLEDFLVFIDSVTAILEFLESRWLEETYRGCDSTAEVCFG